MSSKIRELYALGQSLWYDNISRDLLQSGAIRAVIDEGITGLTSNPSIFQKAIKGGSAYDSQIAQLIKTTRDPKAIYEALAIADIRAAADMLRPVYDRTDHVDGYVSLEVSPLLASDTAGTLAEAERLWKAVDRPNLMIKIPATPEGIPAIEEALFRGLNVNVTLIFSLAMYEQVIEAYLRGLERRAEAGLPPTNASVASFFVSRVDTLVDKLLGDDDSLKGKAAVANARLAYQLFKRKFAGPRWEALAAQGARVQRPLWASTSTKNPAYPDTIYVDSLIGPHTINTAPPHTIEAFKDHGVVALTIEQDIDAAHQLMIDLAARGIDMTAVTDELLADGIAKFADPFNDLLAAIAGKVEQITAAGG
ncbi:MAG: hypothetical protein Kow00124_26020 [Anaerolineae bacterium]